MKLGMHHLDYVFFFISFIAILNVFIYAIYRIALNKNHTSATKLFRLGKRLSWVLYVGFLLLFLAPMAIGISRNGLGQLAQYLPLALMIAVFGVSATVYGIMLSLHKAQNSNATQSTRMSFGSEFFGIVFFGKNLDQAYFNAHKLKIYTIRGLILFQLLIFLIVFLAILSKTLLSASKTGFDGVGVFPILGVMMLVALAVYLPGMFQLFYWVKHNHPQFIPNPLGMPTDMSNLGFLIFILLPQKNATALLPEKRDLIYRVRVSFVVCFVLFIATFLLVLHFNN